MWNGDKKDQYCKTCKKKRTWVKCENCRGRGPTAFTTCKFKCADGYKCEQAPSDPFHPLTD